jgi:hypothetical protein
LAHPEVVAERNKAASHKASDVHQVLDLIKKQNEVVRCP